MDKPHISICLTSIAGRAATSHETLKSLLAQAYPAFDITLSVSDHPHMLDTGVKRVSNAIRELADSSLGRLRIMYTANTGPYRKLMPQLARLRGAEGLIATADDDTLYPPDWLMRLAERYQRHRCVIAYRGHPMLHQDGRFLRYRRWMTSKSKTREGMFILPTGKDGILYNSRFFHPAVLNISKALALAPTTDDLWWRWHTAALGVPVHLINPEYTSDTLPEVACQGSLYENYNREGENDRAISRLVSYGREALGFNFLSAA